MLESNVVIRIREKDQPLVQSMLEDLASEYKTTSGKEITLKIDNEGYLPPETCGGIDLYAQRGRIKINNTLESRLELISSQLIPQIRIALFGRNPNRKFDD